MKLKERLDHHIKSYLEIPCFSLQANYRFKGVQPDKRYGLCCKEFAEEFTGLTASKGMDSSVLDSVDKNHAVSLIFDKESIYMVDLSISQREALDIKGIAHKKRKLKSIPCYSESADTQPVLVGTEKGFNIIHPYRIWYGGGIGADTYRFILNGERNTRSSYDKYKPRIVPLLSILDMKSDHPYHIFVLFTQSSYFIMNQEGTVHSEGSKELEGKVNSLIRKGLTIHDYKNYTDKCRGLYTRTISKTSVLQTR